MRATMPRLCVTKMIATPVCSCNSLQQVEVLRLDRHVEIGRRLVGDDQLRAAGQRDRADDALAHAARHLVRILAHPHRRRGDAHRVQQLAHPLAQRPAAHRPVVIGRLGDLAVDAEQRVQRGHRVLQDHRDLGAADVAHLALAASSSAPGP